MFQLFGKYRDMALAVKNPCHLNMAACLLKFNRYDEAIAQCSIVRIQFLKVDLPHPLSVDNLCMQIFFWFSLKSSFKD